MAEGEELTILVIDDDEDMRRLLSQILYLDGHVVIAVPSAEDGLEQLPWHTFQVAFLDHNLPGMEGLVLGEFLRRNNPHMKVALVTGETDKRLERATRERSITFIAKPFDVAQIRDVVDAYRASASQRLQDSQEAADPGFDPRWREHLDALPEIFGMAGIPRRLEDRLIHQVRDSLSNLRSVSRYNARDRAAALAGLLTAQVLGIDLPRGADGRTLFEEYDAAMRLHGHRIEFE